MKRRLFLLWLRLTRPRSYRRLVRLWNWQFWDRLLNIPPLETPLYSLLPKTRCTGIYHEWKIDENLADRH